MQFLNISSLNDHSLQSIFTTVPKMKHLSIFSINSTSTKLWPVPIMSWHSKGIRFIPTIVTPVTVIITFFLVITLYWKYLWNENGCIHKYTRPQHLPATSSNINLSTISALVHGQPHQVTPQVIQEILRSCDVDLAKFECYKCCKSNHQPTKVPLHIYQVVKFPYSLQPSLSGHAIQKQYHPITNPSLGRAK